MSLREQILSQLSNAPTQPLSEDMLAKHLGLTKKQKASLRHELRKLLGSGELNLVQGDRYRLKGAESELVGTIQFKLHGNAMVILEAGNDEVDNTPIRVEADDTATAIHGDKVAVRVLAGGRQYFNRRDSRGKTGRMGRVLRVVERAQTSLVGLLQKSGRNFYLQPDDPRYPMVTLPDYTNCQITPLPAVGDKIIVELAPWPDRRQLLQGRITNRLGKQFEPAAELLGIYAKFNLDREFPVEVTREANALPSKVRQADLVGRHDFRDTPTITIDPDDAKDFDDALSIEALPQGDTRIGVHIADVSSYVRPGTALDREAQRRGNSTYLVGTVIPMLPERLSNGLCSLVEGEDRLTLATLLTFDKAGALKKTEFARTVIRSRKRLSYRQAFALMTMSDFDSIRALPALPSHQTGATGRPLSSLSDLELVDLQSWIRKFWAIAKKLRQKRMSSGSLDLDMAETKIYVDAKGYADRLVKMEHDESHQLIEEFMLAANESLARLTRTQRLPSLYRVHDDPDERRLLEYREFAATLGVQCGDLTLRPEVVKLLATADTHPQGYILKTQFLRSMRKACYRSTHDGHYGLHKKDYTHFTSPIRRYADLVVHRVLDYYLAKHETTPGTQPPVIALNRAASESLAEHLSLTETNSQEAERESYKIKSLEFFERELDKQPRTVFDAIVTESRMNGFFVELSESGTFGLIPAAELSKIRRPRQLRIGETIKVVVAAVDRYRRLIDFKPAP